jgi:flagellar protein FliS
MNPYFERKILDADPIDLVRLLYQRVIACIREAREHLAHGRIAERAKAISRAHAALSELNLSLRDDAAPDLARNLRNLYAFVQQRLLDANGRQEDRPLVEALGVMVTLLEGWNEVAAGTAGEVSPGARFTVAA